MIKLYIVTKIAIAITESYKIWILFNMSKFSKTYSMLAELNPLVEYIKLMVLENHVNQSISSTLINVTLILR